MDSLARNRRARETPDVLTSTERFPHAEIHHYASVLHRDVKDASKPQVSSLEQGLGKLPRLVLERFERSSGVRPSLLLGDEKPIVYRDGSCRILPFNLLMGVDPPSVARRQLAA